MRTRYIQDPVTLKLVPADEYCPASEERSHMVMSDIQPYQSMATGEMITSRSQHREHLKKHNLMEIGNEVKHLMKPKEKKSDPRLRQMLGELVYSKL